jgi:hypothetical protein
MGREGLKGSSGLLTLAQVQGLPICRCEKQSVEVNLQHTEAD